jgi:hypothetical protein
MIYTDGLIEGSAAGFDEDDPDGLLWNTGLLRLLAEHRYEPLAQLPGRLVERAEELNGGPLLDDVAILLLSSREDDSGVDPVTRYPAGRRRP